MVSKQISVCDTKINQGALDNTSLEIGEHKAQLRQLKMENCGLQVEIKALKSELSAYQTALYKSVELPSKDHGIVIGVIADPELNGVVVHVKEWDNGKCQWHATTLTGRVILLKDDNILRHRDFDQMPESSNSDFAGT